MTLVPPEEKCAPPRRLRFGHSLFTCGSFSIGSTQRSEFGVRVMKALRLA